MSRAIDGQGASSQSSKEMINTQGEKLEIVIAPGGHFEGKPILALHDDYPGKVVAYHLFDYETAEYLRDQIKQHYPELIPELTDANS